MWRECGFHRDITEATCHVSSETTNELIKSIRLLADAGSDQKTLVVSGPGGIGKSYQLLEAIGAMRNQGYGVLLPGKNWLEGSDCLDDSANLFYHDYKFNWRGSVWIDG